MPIVSFASFPVPPPPRDTPENDGDDTYMDLDDPTSSGAKLAAPGEAITSAQAFMRFVFYDFTIHVAQALA